jgi:hypothetical protein
VGELKVIEKLKALTLSSESVGGQTAEATATYMYAFVGWRCLNIVIQGRTDTHSSSLLAIRSPSID